MEGERRLEDQGKYPRKRDLNMWQAQKLWSVSHAPHQERCMVFSLSSIQNGCKALVCEKEKVEQAKNESGGGTI